MNKLAKERTIYSNYDLWETYPDDTLKELILENGVVENEEDISEEMLTEYRYSEDSFTFESEWGMLEEFFKDKTVILFGEFGLWNRIAKGGKIGEFKDLFYSATKDCDYVNIYDKNGHFHITCSHHDGTNSFEIKILTEKGEEYLDRWEYDCNYNDKRTVEDIHTQIIKRYSVVPNYAHTVYGCPKREYEPQSKEAFTKILNNQARSNYS